MKISLRKVGNTPLDFELKSDKVAFKGYLQYHGNKLILLKANLSGLLDIECDLCTKDFELPVDEDIEFFISDGVYEDKEEASLDVVESLDSQIDLEELLNSEIELIKSDYFSCDDCKTKERN
ncbi:hypothetical protein KKG72_06515 [bacterium]|nr:hypothetical protein [bacterium]MBU1993305.1 hypothetical protein [bacterium]